MYLYSRFITNCIPLSFVLRYAISTIYIPNFFLVQLDLKIIAGKLRNLSFLRLCVVLLFGGETDVEKPVFVDFGQFNWEIG